MNATEIKSKIADLKEEWVKQVLELDPNPNPFVLPAQYKKSLELKADDFVKQLLIKWQDAGNTLQGCLKEFLKKNPEIFTEKVLKDFDLVFENSKKPLANQNEIERSSLRERLQFSEALLKTVYEISCKLMEEKRFSEASHLFFLLTQVEPLESLFHESLGTAYYYDQNIPEAKFAYLAAILTDQDNPLPFYYLAYIQQEEGFFDQALVTLDEAKAANIASPNDEILNKIENLIALINKKKGK